MTEEQSPKRAKTDPEQGKVAEDVIDLDAEEPEVENEADAVLEQELRNAQAQLNIVRFPIPAATPVYTCSAYLVSVVFLKQCSATVR